MSNSSDEPSGARDLGTSVQRRDVASYSSIITSLFLTGGLFVGVLCSRSSMRSTFADFGTKVPVLTDVVLSASFAWLVGILFGLTVLKEALLKSLRREGSFGIRSPRTSL